MQGKFKPALHKDLDGTFTKLWHDAGFLRGTPKGLCCSLAPSGSYNNPLCCQSAGRQKMPTIYSINECSVCAFPLPGNLVTGTAAAWVLDPQLFALCGCQLPSMPCTNYCLWINLVLSLARTEPRLIFLADHAYTHTQTHSSRDKQAFMWLL